MTAAAMNATRLRLTEAVAQAERQAHANRILLDQCETIKTSQDLTKSLSNHLDVCIDLVGTNAAVCIGMVRDRFQEMRATLAAREEAVVAMVLAERAEKLESLKLEIDECKDNRQKVAQFEEMVEQAAGGEVEDSLLHKISKVGEELKDMQLLVQTQPEFPCDVGCDNANATIQKIKLVRSRPNPAQAARAVLDDWTADQNLKDELTERKALLKAAQVERVKMVESVTRSKSESVSTNVSEPRSPEMVETPRTVLESAESVSSREGPESTAQKDVTVEAQISQLNVSPAILEMSVEKKATRRRIQAPGVTSSVTLEMDETTLGHGGWVVTWEPVDGAISYLLEVGKEGSYSAVYYGPATKAIVDIVEGDQARVRAENVMGKGCWSTPCH